jgi:hypothetical protein
MTIRLCLTIEADISDMRAFAREAWKAARDGGFTTKAEWSTYRKDRIGYPLRTIDPITVAFREMLYSRLAGAGLDDINIE